VLQNLAVGMSTCTPGVGQARVHYMASPPSPNKQDASNVSN
jgi:hypothetical protein